MINTFVIGTHTLIRGDCRKVLQDMPENSVDAIVTDPPYNLGFMGKKWDSTGIAFDPETWRLALRVLKPGGHMLAFGGSRTFHRIACAIEDAGFEIRDTVMWLYANGFPRGRNLSGEWRGWSTALKPAFEPIVLARKPLIGTVAANMLEHCTGALNINDCRIESDSSISSRWPANIIHDGSDEVLTAFPYTTSRDGISKGVGGGTRNCYGRYASTAVRKSAGRRDAGSAARFFYCAKASRADRNDGLPDPGPQFKRGTTLRKIENTATTGNTHPTVKPTALMRYLVRLITPPGGTVLDSFAGSGSTGRACALEGFASISIEQDAHHCDIAAARIRAAVKRARAEAEQAEREQGAQNAQGGRTEGRNLATACRSCNRAKGARTPDEWRRANG